MMIHSVIVLLAILSSDAAVAATAHDRPLPPTASVSAKMTLHDMTLMNIKYTEKLMPLIFFKQKKKNDKYGRYSTSIKINTFFLPVQTCSGSAATVSNYSNNNKLNNK